MTLYEQLGIWPKDDELTFCKVEKKKIFEFLFASFLACIATCVYLADNKSESLYLIPITILYAIITVKSIYLLQKNTILEFVNDPIMCHRTEDRHEHDRLSNTIANFMMCIHVYLAAVFITQVLHVLYFIFRSIAFSDRMLPLFITFSWHDSEIVYWCTFAVLSGLIVSSVFVILFTALIWYIMINYSIEYELLGHKLKTLGTKQGTTFCDELIILVKDHRNLKK